VAPLFADDEEVDFLRSDEAVFFGEVLLDFSDTTTSPRARRRRRRRRRKKERKKERRKKTREKRRQRDLKENRYFFA